MIEEKADCLVNSGLIMEEEEKKKKGSKANTASMVFQEKDAVSIFSIYSHSKLRIPNNRTICNE